jgi:hypothetical protein
LSYLFNLRRKAGGPIVDIGSNRPTEQESQTPGGSHHGWQHLGQAAKSISQHFSTFHPRNSLST